MCRHVYFTQAHECLKSKTAQTSILAGQSLVVFTGRLHLQGLQDAQFRNSRSESFCICGTSFSFRIRRIAAAEISSLWHSTNSISFYGQGSASTRS
jgi:hypothetical protein